MEASLPTAKNKKNNTQSINQNNKKNHKQNNSKNNDQITERSEHNYCIGDYVKVTGLVENTELNGQLGVVIPKRNPFEQERISVRVLFKKSSTQAGFSKKDISILATNLVRVKKPSANPKFTVVRKILASMYLKDRHSRRIINSNAKGAIRQEILKVLGDPDLLENSLAIGEKALKAHKELATLVDALLLHMQKK